MHTSTVTRTIYTRSRNCTYALDLPLWFNEFRTHLKHTTFVPLIWSNDSRIECFTLWTDVILSNMNDRSVTLYVTISCMGPQRPLGWHALAQCIDIILLYNSNVVTHISATAQQLTSSRWGMNSYNPCLCCFKIWTDPWWQHFHWHQPAWSVGKRLPEAFCWSSSVREPQCLIGNFFVM